MADTRAASNPRTAFELTYPRRVAAKGLHVGEQAFVNPFASLEPPDCQSVIAMSAR